MSSYAYIYEALSLLYHLKLSTASCSILKNLNLYLDNTFENIGDERFKDNNYSAAPPLWQARATIAKERMVSINKCLANHMWLDLLLFRLWYTLS